MELEILYPEMDKKERANMLHANADKVENGIYYRPLTEDELTVKRNQLVSVLENEDRLADEKKELVRDLTERIKQLKAERKLIMQAVKSRQEERAGDLYHFADHNAGIMKVYDEEGVCILDRRLRPDERQATIHSTLRAVSNG